MLTTDAGESTRPYQAKISSSTCCNLKKKYAGVRSNTALFISFANGVRAAEDMMEWFLCDESFRWHWYDECCFYIEWFESYKRYLPSGELWFLDLVVWLYLSALEALCCCHRLLGEVHFKAVTWLKRVAWWQWCIFYPIRHELNAAMTRLLTCKCICAESWGSSMKTSSNQWAVWFALMIQTKNQTSW